MNQHCTSHHRRDITRDMGSLQRAFKGGNGPFPPLLIRQRSALMGTPEPAASTCKPRSASPHLMRKGHFFHQKGSFPAESSGTGSCLSPN